MKSLFKHPARSHSAKPSSKRSTRRSSFTDLRAVDNFYQTSLFFPMPAVLVSTLTDEGKTTCGPYSLLAPFYVAGKEYYAFMLECRNSSNTAQNLLKHKKCVINFMADDRKTFKEMVRLGWPGDTPAEKMKDFAFHLENGLRKAEDPKGTYPKVISEALQAVECTWVDTLDSAQDDGPLPDGADHYELEKYHDFNGITSPYGAHFVLRIDKILMKPRYRDAIVNGVRAQDFPPLPVDYGYRGDDRSVRALRSEPAADGCAVHGRGSGETGQGPAHLPAYCTEGLCQLGGREQRQTDRCGADGHYQRQAFQRKEQVNNKF